MMIIVSLIMMVIAMVIVAFEEDYIKANKKDPIQEQLDKMERISLELDKLNGKVEA